MVETLTVDLSRNELHEVLPATSKFETDGSFELIFVNHDRAAHVHVHPDDALARGVEIADPNVYVETDARKTVGVAVPDGPRPLRGTLEISAGYGAGDAVVDVGIVDDPEPELPVDESLGEPAPRADADDDGLSLASLATSESLPVLGLAAVALAIAVVAVSTIDDPVVLAGAVAVIAGVLGAIYALLTE